MRFVQIYDFNRYPDLNAMSEAPSPNGFFCPNQRVEEAKAKLWSGSLI